MSATEKARAVISAAGELTAHALRASRLAEPLPNAERAGTTPGASPCVVVLLLAPVVYSYVTTMLRPSSLPLGIRSVEWVRTHHGAWLVNEAENSSGTRGTRRRRAGRRCGRSRRSASAPARLVHSARAVYRPRADRAGDPPRAARRGGLALDRARRRRRAARPRDDVPNRPGVPARSSRTSRGSTTRAPSSRSTPGRYEPPNASPRGPMEVPQSQRWRLLATFNSGFMNRDSHGGFFVDGAARRHRSGRGQGTIVAYKDGRVDVISWHGRSRSRAEGRPRAAEPAADRRPRPAESAPRGQLALGKHARQCGTRLAIRRRHRPPRQPHLPRSRGPDGREPRRRI